MEEIAWETVFFILRRISQHEGIRTTAPYPLPPPVVPSGKHIHALGSFGAKGVLIATTALLSYNTFKFVASSGQGWPKRDVFVNEKCRALTPPPPWITPTHRPWRLRRRAVRDRQGQYWPLTALRFCVSLCRSVVTLGRIKQKKGIISQLLTKFDLFTGINRRYMFFIRRNAPEWRNHFSSGFHLIMCVYVRCKKVIARLCKNG